MKKCFAVLSLLFFIVGCDKSEIRSSPYENKAMIATSNAHQTFEINNTHPIPSYNLLSEFYKTLDENYFDSTNISATETYVINRNSEISNYLSVNFPQYSNISLTDTYDPLFFIFGIVHAIVEEQIAMESLYLSGKDFEIQRRYWWAHCALGVLSGYATIEGLITDYRRLFTQAASWDTVWPVIKNTLRRYVGWFLVASIGYDM